MFGVLLHGVLSYEPASALVTMLAGDLDLSEFLPFSKDPRDLPVAVQYRHDIDAAVVLARELGYAVHRQPSRGFFWRVYSAPECVRLPPSGWKIHISYAPSDLGAPFAEVLTWLLQSHLTFKLPATLQGLVWINSGGIGLNQIGKIVTIYTEGRDHCERIIRDLKGVLKPTTGPEVPTDLQVLGCRGVSVRFGSFSNGSPEPDDFGRYQTFVVDAKGRRVPDRRDDIKSSRRGQPSSPSGLVAPRKVSDARMKRIGGRQYMLLSNLHTGPKGSVYLACDVRSLETYVIKSVKPGVYSDPNGFDASARLGNEYARLVALAKLGAAVPAPIAFDGKENLLVLGDLGGKPALNLTRAQQITCLVKLFDEIRRIHELGFVHRDIKLSNVVVARRKVFVTDFELCQKVGERKRIIGGTRNYERGTRPDEAISPAEDLYAFAMAIAHTFLKSDPAMHAEGAGRFIGLLSIFAASPVAKLVRDLVDEKRCLKVTAEAVRAALTRKKPDGGRGRTRAFPVRPQLRQLRNWSRRAAINSATAALAYFEESERVSGQGNWKNQHLQPDFACEGLDSGSSGCILALTIIADLFGYSALDRYLLAGSRWLANNSPPKYSAGLFTGNGGVAIALAVAARRLGEPSLIDSARVRIRCAIEHVRESDLYSGAAGVVLATCLLNELGVEEDGASMVAALASRLRRRARRTGSLTLWKSSGRLDKTTEHYLGAAHGAAGIAAALGRYARFTGNADLCAFAKDVIWSIYREGQTTDKKSLRYTLERPDTHVDNTIWCHGAGGTAHALLLGFGDDPDLREPLDWMVGQFLRACVSRPLTNTTMCHGLAGRLELLRMLTSISRYRRTATFLSDRTALTLRLTSVRRAGCVVWPSEDSYIFTPDLWIGFLGPAVQLGLWFRRSHDSLFSARVLTGLYDR
jgi:tRNA A-37 threonylcarbamoyl transferase component Bud32